MASSVELTHTHVRRSSRGLARDWIDPAPAPTLPLEPYRDDEGDEKAALIAAGDGQPEPLRQSLSLRRGTDLPYNASRGGLARVVAILVISGGLLASGFALGANSVAVPHMPDPLAWLARYYGHADSGSGASNATATMSPAWRPVRDPEPKLHWKDNLLPNRRYLTHVPWGGNSNQIFEVRVSAQSSRSHAAQMMHGLYLAFITESTPVVNALIPVRLTDARSWADGVGRPRRPSGVADSRFGSFQPRSALAVSGHAARRMA